MTKELAKVRRYGKVVYDWAGRMIYYVNKKNIGLAAFSFEEVKTLEANGDVIVINGKKWVLESTSRMGIMPIGAVCDDEQYHRLYVERLRLSAEAFRLSEALSLTTSQMNLILDEKAHEIEKNTTFWLSTVSLDDTYEKRRDFLWAHGLDSTGFYQATMQQALYIWRRAGQDAIVKGIAEVEPYILPVDGEFKLIGYPTSASHDHDARYLKTKDGKDWWLVDQSFGKDEDIAGPMCLEDAVAAALSDMYAEEDE